MRPITGVKFFKKTAPWAYGGGDDYQDVSTACDWDEVGAWRSSGGPWRIRVADCERESTLRNSRVRDMEEKSRSAIDPIEVDGPNFDCRQDLGDCAIGALENRVEKSFNHRTFKGENSVDLCWDDLNSAHMDHHMGSSAAAFVNLAESCVNPFYTPDDRVSDFVGEISMQSTASFGVNAFKILDDRAAEVLRKSKQALERSTGLKSGSLISAAQELKSRWPREQGYSGPPRRRELNDSSCDVNLATAIHDLKKFARNRVENLKNPDLPEKPGGTFPNGSVSYNTKQKLSVDHFVEFEKLYQSSAGRPSSPNNWVDDQKHCGGHSNLVNCSIDEDLKGGMSPPRICRWARLSPKLLRVETVTNPHRHCNQREEVNISSLSKYCITNTSHPCKPEHTEEDECEQCRRHRKMSEPAELWYEKDHCFRKQPESSRKVEMQDSDGRQVQAGSELHSSSQVAATSGPQDVHHDSVVKGPETLYSCVESGRILEVRSLSSSPENCEKISNRICHIAEVTEMQYPMLHEKEKGVALTPNLNVTHEESLHDDRGSSCSDWTVEGVGCIVPRPSTPLKIERAKYSSVTGVIEVRSAKASSGENSPHSELENLPSPACKYGARKTSKELTRSSRHSNKPMVSPRKTIPVILSSPRRRGITARRGDHHRGMNELNLKSEDNRARESQRTGKRDGQVIFCATQKIGTAVALNISITPFERKQETNQTSSAGTNSPRNSSESKCTQTRTMSTTEVLDKIMESECQATKCSQIVELSSENKPSDQNNQLPSMERVQCFSKTLTSSHEDQISSSRSTTVSDSDASQTFNSQGGSKVRHWPRIIPELDDWILEVVSGWMGTECCPSQNAPADASVTVSPRESVVNATRTTTCEETSPLPGPKTALGFWVSDVLNKSLDREIQRLAEFDSRISRAHSVSDLFEVLKGFSTIQPSLTVQRSTKKKTAKKMTHPMLEVHVLQEDEGL